MEIYKEVHFQTKLNPEEGEFQGKKSAKIARHVWNQFALPKLGCNRLVVDVITRDIDKMMAEAPAPGTARSIKIFTRAAFNYARKWGFIPESRGSWGNPATNAMTIKVKQREVGINAEEYVRAVAETEKIREEPFSLRADPPAPSHRRLPHFRGRSRGQRNPRTPLDEHRRPGEDRHPPRDQSRQASGPGPLGPVPGATSLPGTWPVTIRLSFPPMP